MVTGKLQGLIGLSVDVTHLQAVGLPQCKPTQVSSLSRSRDTEQREKCAKQHLIGLCMSMLSPVWHLVHYQASVAMTVDCYCTVTLYKQ